MNEVIQANGLTKVYPSDKKSPPLRAVDGIDFTVHQGEVFGFLGPNGAGKTTTIRMLTGLIQPTSGSAHILDMDLVREITKIKKHIGVVPETSNLYDELTAFDNLVFCMQLYGVPRSEWKSRAESLLERFRLSEKRDTPFSKLSRGMKRALTIAAALAHHPSLVFLDEPTTGLDVMNARNLRKMIEGFHDEGVTVFLTTHYLEEAERLCDRVAIIVGGHIVALDTIDGLKTNINKKNMIEVTLGKANGQLEKKRYEYDDSIESTLRQALKAANGYHLISVNTIRPSLEDVFVKMSGLSSDIMLTEKGGK